MKKIALIIAFSLASSFLSLPAYAGGTLSQSIAMKVQRANNLQLDDKLEQAITLLAELSPIQDYDKAFVQRMLGVFYWQDGKTKAAIASLSQSLNSGALQGEKAWSTQRMLADILLSEQDYKQALIHYYALTKAIPASEKGSEIWLRIAQIYYQLGQWQNVLTAMKPYNNYALEDTRSPLSITLGAQLQLQRWKAAIPTLKRLIVLEPKKLVWWQQLANIQLRTNNNVDALSTLKLAKYQGVPLEQQDLHRLAQLYALQGIPERAAKQIAALAQANTRVDLLAEQANYWQMAREWKSAITIWRKAAREDEQYRWQLAQLLLQEGQYAQSIEVFDKVSRKGNQADVELAKVHAYYKLAQFDKALIHAKKADAITPSSAAKGWMRYLAQMIG